jgi:H+/Cl- antiporter ClcA
MTALAWVLVYVATGVAVFGALMLLAGLNPPSMARKHPIAVTANALAWPVWVVIAAVVLAVVAFAFVMTAAEAVAGAVDRWMWK